MQGLDDAKKMLINLLKFPTLTIFKLMITIYKHAYFDLSLNLRVGLSRKQNENI